MIKQIMIAHDLSQEAEIALARATQLAQQHQARLIITHCVTETTDLSVVKQQVKQQLQAQLAQLTRGLLETELVVKAGQPSIKLAELVRAYSVDLLVVGQHHQTSPEGFSGTTLERLLQKVKVPVLLAVNAQLASYQQSLIAMDFSKTASRAFQRLIKTIPAATKITALHICEVAEKNIDQATTDELQWQQELFNQIVSDECAAAKVPQTRVQQKVMQGELFNCLEQSIQALQPQLIALGRHGRGEMADALLGSLTHSFLAQPPCDLLVVS